MEMDWKSALAALGASGALPEGEPEKEDEKSVPDAVQTSAVKIYIDKKKRKGKEATVIEGFECSEERLKEIARTLKQTLGCGGSQRNGEILLQGDVREKAAECLKKMGYKSKRGN